MKRSWQLVTWLFLLVCTLPQMPAQAPQLAGEKAQRLYRDGSYAEAQVEYEKVLAKVVDGRIEYNLGNCEFRQGRYAHALWRYERALRELGARSDIVFNRDLCLRKLDTRSRGAEGMLASLRARVAELSVGQWFMISISLEVFGLLFLLLLLRRYSHLRILFCVTLFGLAAASTMRAMSLQEQEEIGVVVLKDRLPLRSEPRTELSGKLILDLGRRADYVAKTAAWIKLRLEFEGQRHEGWIPRESGGIY